MSAGLGEHREFQRQGFGGTFRTSSPQRPCRPVHIFLYSNKSTQKEFGTLEKGCPEVCIGASWLQKT